MMITQNFKIENISDIDPNIRTAMTETKLNLESVVSQYALVFLVLTFISLGCAIALLILSHLMKQAHDEKTKMYHIFSIGGVLALGMATLSIYLFINYPFNISTNNEQMDKFMTQAARSAINKNLVLIERRTLDDPSETNLYIRPVMDDVTVKNTGVLQKNQTSWLFGLVVEDTYRKTRSKIENPSKSIEDFNAFCEVLAKTNDKQSLKASKKDTVTIYCTFDSSYTYGNVL